jgi:hypothetical protein
VFVLLVVAMMATGCVPRPVDIQVMASGVPLTQRRWS